MLECKEGMREYNQVFAYGSRFVDFTMRFPAYYKKSLQRDRVVYYDRRIGELQGAAIIAACEQERAVADAAGSGNGSGSGSAASSGSGMNVATATDTGMDPIPFPDLSEILTVAVCLLSTLLLPPLAL